jgi:hypothetical protein
MIGSFRLSVFVKYLSGGIITAGGDGIGVLAIQVFGKHHASGDTLNLGLAERRYAAASGFPVVECLSLYALATGPHDSRDEKAVVGRGQRGEIVVEASGVNLLDLLGCHNFVF